ncbi:mucolipin-3 isoform X7 [Hypanus sabinus]|uniref:mucolipin-3 isoform X7 n=1 Tax=Hypanus sabinus TaxID=79690 RepID=UPI0028C3AC29|nr:mucolipin-3 isoform X7 [Hypanus sabinus]
MGSSVSRPAEYEMQVLSLNSACPDVKQDMLGPDLATNAGGGAVADSIPQKRDEGSVIDPDSADHLQRKLKFFFMNPCEKFQARGRKPWKLGVQILKIAMVTVQLVLFGLSNQMVVLFKEENTVAFKHLFIKNYVDSASSGFAIYTQSEVYEYLSFIFSQYVKLPKISVGNHAYERRGSDLMPLTMCQYFYKWGNVSPGNESFFIDPRVERECLDIKPISQSLRAQLVNGKLNVTLHFHRLLMIQVQFKLKTINLQTIRRHELPDCYDFLVTITFDNKPHSGRIQINLDNDVSIRKCKGQHITGEAQGMTHYMIFDIVIVGICVISLILCTRSVMNGIQLQHNFALYDVCSILLGTSTLFVWIGVIRYLGFFQKYNVLILTLRAAFPNVIRFCCCASMIYLGYCFCGWIVLGPYHHKFRSLTMVSECLFSLINGDDMYLTFASMQDKSYLVWLFSRLYLYSFISLFIYMVLSLFIALITGTYETIKLNQQNGFPQTDLHTFVAECKDLPDSGRYQVKEEVPFSLCCCCNRSKSETET